MKRWQYLCKELPIPLKDKEGKQLTREPRPEIQDQLDKLGMEGWEIVHLQAVTIPSPVAGGMPNPLLSCIFKREALLPHNASGVMLGK